MAHLEAGINKMADEESGEGEEEAEPKKGIFTRLVAGHRRKGEKHSDRLEELRKQAAEEEDEGKKAKINEEIRARESGGRYLGGAVHHITKRKRWVVAVILAIVGSSIGFLVLGAFGILIGLAVIFLYLLFKKWPKFTIALILLIVVGYFLWLFYFGGGGYYSAEAGKFGTEFKSMFKPMTAEIGMTKMILTGEYDPSEIWTSKVYKSRYAQQAGFEVSDVKPLREYFSTRENAVVVGRLKITALPESPDKGEGEVDVSISASGPESMSWGCNPSHVRSKSFFGRFQCTSGSYFSVGSGREQESKEASVTVRINQFETIAGKSTYVVDYNTLNLIYLEDEDPMKYYELEKEQIQSWQSNSPINLGLGILGEKNVIAANDVQNTAPYYLGVTVRNTGAGDLTGIWELRIEIPEKVTFKEGSDNDFRYKDGNRQTACSEKLGTLTLCKYELKDSSKLSGKLEPGDYATYYLKFEVWKDSFLREANIKEFFALADIKFDYEDITPVPITIKKI